jgi:hypothetical protein
MTMSREDGLRSSTGQGSIEWWYFELSLISYKIMILQTKNTLDK